jgi:glycosyltransferase involved in cell wall biosynthesis
LNIVQFHTQMRFEEGGVVRAVFDLSSALAARGHDVRVLTSDVADLPKSWTSGEVGRPRAVELPPPARIAERFDRSSLSIVQRQLADADMLHLHQTWAPRCLQLASLARRLKVPYVMSVHGVLDDWCMDQKRRKKRMFLWLAARRMLESAAAVHCTAQGELEQARKWFPRGRGVAIPLAVDLSIYRTLPGPAAARKRIEALRSSRPTLLFLSRVHYKKQIELLIQATDALKRAGRNCLAIIAGSGDADYVARLRRLVSERGLDDDVIFPGFLDGRDKVSLYEAADVFVLPTSQENFGFVLFEALAAGTPVITTRGADTWPELERSGGALIVPAETNAIASAVRELLDDPERRVAMGQRGRQWVFDNLDGDRIIESFERLYTDVVSRR